MEQERETQPTEQDIDPSLLDWYLKLTVTERLRAASKCAATLERLRRAASTNG